MQSATWLIILIFTIISYNYFILINTNQQVKNKYTLSPDSNICSFLVDSTLGVYKIDHTSGKISS